MCDCSTWVFMYTRENWWMNSRCAFQESEGMFLFLDWGGNALWPLGIENLRCPYCHFHLITSSQSGAVKSALSSHLPLTLCITYTSEQTFKHTHEWEKSAAVNNYFPIRSWDYKIRCGPGPEKEKYRVCCYTRCVLFLLHFSPQHTLWFISGSCTLKEEKVDLSSFICYSESSSHFTPQLV